MSMYSIVDRKGQRREFLEEVMLSDRNKTMLDFSKCKFLSMEGPQNAFSR